MIRSFEIKSTFGNYEVEFNTDSSEYSFSKHDDRSDYVVLADRLVWNLYKNFFPSWSSFPLYLVDANEETKTLEQVNRFSLWMARNGCTKSSTILAFGGGVIQDLATFTARNFHRGCFWEYHPTTLLSQADSCIGSKCGINVLPYKNQLGTIYAPKRVVIHEYLLTSLPYEEILSGFGEIIKLSVTGEGQFYEELVKALVRNGNRIPRGEEMTELIRKSLFAKKLIIEEDELEKGPRRVLNYGHSFGHALESLSNNEITHGTAIVFGMDLVNYLGMQWGITKIDFYEKFKSLVASLYDATTLPREISGSRLVQQLKNDKKMAYGIMTFAVPIMEGQIELIQKPLDEELTSLVEKYLHEENVFSTS